MSLGRLVWWGTSLFLKKKFGIGYNLSFTTNNEKSS